MTILVPVASGPLRDRVLQTAIELGQALGEDLYIVHLVEEETADGTAKQIRDEIRERVRSADVAATVSLEYVGHGLARTGPRIGQDVIELASDVTVTHIVMGHTSKGLLEEITRGSAAQAVIDAATVPVTVVPDTTG
ncbi:universal stress protein [Halapricum hydrolyticum]|uniref:Universal stress protein n=1 Tax=Halapricum hydrolyticum TaxID=2979991 RepID=A0AAE3LGK3_9EURY|nr:universal stress protein [Halapricum hydrolyticum]MCU4716681.1 universal stress protein [Halapricum hydrolyticum]MCU4725714.1 universal stress protein [Halapricum hydrolyticum]